jgi:hypothetical protein
MSAAHAPNTTKLARVNIDLTSIGSKAALRDPHTGRSVPIAIDRLPRERSTVCASDAGMSLEWEAYAKPVRAVGFGVSSRVLVPIRQTLIWSSSRMGISITSAAWSGAGSLPFLAPDTSSLTASGSTGRRQQCLTGCRSSSLRLLASSSLPSKQPASWRHSPVSCRSRPTFGSYPHRGTHRPTWRSRSAQRAGSCTPSMPSYIHFSTGTPHGDEGWIWPPILPSRRDMRSSSWRASESTQSARRTGTSSLGLPHKADSTTTRTSVTPRWPRSGGVIGRGGLRQRFERHPEAKVSDRLLAVAVAQVGRQQFVETKALVPDHARIKLARRGQRPRESRSCMCVGCDLQPDHFIRCLWPDRRPPSGASISRRAHLVG